MKRIRQSHPELFELEKHILTVDHKSEQIGMRVQKMEPGPQHERLVEELTQHLKEAFDLKQQQRRMQAEEIERELREIRTRIQKRDLNKQRIIARRLDDLAADHEVYEWQSSLSFP